MMENQVTSIEQSRRLLELGVPAEKASMRWGIYRDFGENSNRCKLLLSNQDVFADYATYIPAFTVSDLLGILPDEIDTNYFGKCFLCINKHKCHTDTWHLYYKDDAGYTFFECTSERGIIPVLYATVEQLGSMGYLTE